MRDDQIARLKDLAEGLADRFLMDADPADWPGGSKLPADMSQQERGDAVWCRKMAMATGGVLRYTLDLLAKVPPDSTPESAAQESDMDRQIKDAERRAAEAVARAKRNVTG